MHITIDKGNIFERQINFFQLEFLSKNNSNLDPKPNEIICLMTF